MQTKPKRPTLLREVGRNLRRRKLRSILTLSGIGLGAFALTVMGSLAENFNHSIGSLREYLEEQVLVRPKGSSIFFSSGHLPMSMLGSLERVEGVEVAVPRVTVLFDEAAEIQFGPERAIDGVDIARARRSPIADLKLATGRWLEPGDRWKIVLGADLVRQFKVGDRFASAGDRVVVRKHEFEIVGVAQATGTPVDDFATTSIEDTRQIAKETDPGLDVTSIADEFSVYPREGIAPKDLTADIRKVATDAVVFPPELVSEQIASLVAIWNSIILGSALVALLVGGVAIINTMVFSVTERTREIGTKKAIGASSRDILREFLSESAILSFAGGIGGGVVGYLFTRLLNRASQDRGVIAFSVTPRLAVFVFVLSLAIGVGAGLLPARRAARIDPVRALRTLG